MRVLLVGYLHGLGGIQSHTHWLAAGLSEHGISVTVLTPPPIDGHVRQLDQSRPYQVTIYENRGFAGYQSAICQFRSAGAFDIAVVCGTGWLAMIGVLANRRIRKRVFFEVMSGDRNGWLDPRSLVHLGFDAVVGQAPTVESNFRRAFAWSKRSTSIPALPDPLELSTNIQTPSPDYSKGIRAAYFGRLASHKGVGHLVDQWDALSSSIAVLDIYGTGPQEAELLAKVQDRGLGDRISFCGVYPSGAQYVSLIQKYHLLLLPTTGKEGAPLVLLEAMACGLPFVANGVGGIPNYTNPDCSITSGDIVEFVPAVREMSDRLVNGSVDLDRLRNFYAERFSFRALIGSWLEFLVGLAFTT